MSRQIELGLTPREQQVALLVKDGLTDRDIAERLFITRRTAEWHLKQIFNKLGFNSRAQVAAWVAREPAPDSNTDSRDSHRHNFPIQLTTFVGRESHIAEVRRLLTVKRLVTLTGVGGSGKTRLAIEVAARTLDAYPDGAWLVDLTPIRDGRLVPRAFGSALRVHERPRQRLAETLVDHLRDRRILLVVDNCEHLIEECAALVDCLLGSCIGTAVLATSREPLRVSGETVWRVPSLAVPDPATPIDVEELARCEAVVLFSDRAQLAAPAFQLSLQNAAAVGALCSGLDGLPLAIELAAARAGMMSPEQILERLQDRFGLLTGGSRTGPARHRTLQSALDWSHDLLTDEERRLFRRLSVFAGSFSLEAIEQVCAGDDLDGDAITGVLGSLVDKSMVITAGETSGPIRFRMLETLQQYAHKRLAECGEVELLSRRHCAFFVSLAEQAAPNLIGREQAWHARLAQDISNLRSVLEWCCGREPEGNLRLNSALTYFWHSQGLVQEGDGWFTRALADYSVRNELRAQALSLAGEISYWRQDIVSASARWHECLDIYRELGDVKGIGEALAWVGTLAEWQGNFEKAHKYFDEGLAMSREAQHARAIEWIIRNLGRLAMKEGDYGHALTYLQESLVLSERLGNERPTIAALGYLGLNALESGDFAAARTHLEKALMIACALDFAIGVATNLRYLAALAAAQSLPIRALHLAAASEALADSAGAAPIRLTKAIVERWLDRSRREVGPERSTACQVEGRAMTRERAIDYALKD